MANFNVVGYPTPFGNKWCITIDHTGPASYNNTGTFATSGETINASDVGLGGIENIDSMLSSDGLNVIYIASPAAPTSVLLYGSALASFALHWFVVATGAEVANAVNLSSKSVRLQIFGV